MAAGNLFVALPGTAFDGMTISKVGASSGRGLLIQATTAGPGSPSYLLVPDTVRPGRLAADWRGFALPGAALTGSAGKTTTKEMTARILEGGRRVLKTAGNQNNLIGLPLTLFRLQDGHEVAVLELGTNRPGEIARLTAIAWPDAALITNIGPAHLEGVGSLEGPGRKAPSLPP
jgi:UDP-N-acetylmuramoyl-tripeptide--D-alanyl-D-alanine ligase